METLVRPDLEPNPTDNLHGRVVNLVRDMKNGEQEIHTKQTERGQLSAEKQNRLNTLVQRLKAQEITLADITLEDKQYILPPRKVFELEIRHKYMQDKDDPVARFADLFLSSETAWKVQQTKNILDSKGKQRTEAENADYKKYKHQLTVFNHKLKEAILQTDGSISRSDFVNWLSTVGKMPIGGAEKLIAGIGAEVAVAGRMHAIPEIESIGMPTIAEDGRGVDIIVHLENGRRVTIDVKTGGNQSDGHTTANVEINVEQYEVEGFQINEAYTDVVDRRIRLELGVL